MDQWQVWVVVALFFVLIEIFTSGFAVACFSFGALAAALCSVFGLSYIWQLVAFAVVSIIALATIRPLVLKLFQKKDNEKTNADALVGKVGRVSQKIDPETGKGRVALDGDDWKSVSEDVTAIEKGAKVVVTKVDSVILTVKKQ